MDDHELWEDCCDEIIAELPLVVLLSVDGVKEALVEYFNNDIVQRMKEKKEQE